MGQGKQQVSLQAAKLRFRHAAFLTALVTSITGQTASARPSDAAIKQKIIKESIASYPGNCPCPYNSASNGSRCGGRSAWSRAGGYAPKCYEADVTAADIAAYKRSH
jgi:hypothetical protein